jgi:uncharacterized membrane protein
MKLKPLQQYNTWKALLKYFFQGLLITAPVAITGYVLYSIFTSIDSWLPLLRVKDAQGNTHTRNYGLGVVFLLAAILLIGYLSSFFIKSRVFNMFDNWLEKTPGIKFIYSTTKDVFGAFAGNKKKFNKPVLAAIESEEVFRIGFITETDLGQFGLNSHVAVYLPAAYSISGYVYLVPFYRVKQLDNVSAADAMKFAISGGVADVEDENEKEKNNPV